MLDSGPSSEVSTSIIISLIVSCCDTIIYSHRFITTTFFLDCIDEFCLLCNFSFLPYLAKNYFINWHMAYQFLSMITNRSMIGSLIIQPSIPDRFEITTRIVQRTVNDNALINYSTDDHRSFPDHNPHVSATNPISMVYAEFISVLDSEGITSL